MMAFVTVDAWTAPGSVDGLALSVRGSSWRAPGSSFAAARSSATYCSRETPALPVRHPAWSVAQGGACDLHPEHVRGVGDDEIAHPARRRGSAVGDGMLGGHGADDG